MEKTLRCHSRHYCKKLISKDLSAKDLLPYNWPTDKKIKKSKISEIFLGYYFKWDPQKNFKISQNMDFPQL